MRKILLGLLLLLPLPAQAEAPKVVVSIAPLAGIAAAVMEGVGAPVLLVQGNASPHTYQLRPSEAQLLGEADIVLWAGKGLETFLAKPLGALADRADVITLMAEKDLQLLPVREGALWQAQDNHHHHHDHAHDSSDAHLWLDPDNAIAIARLLAARLSASDTANAATYAANAGRFADNLKQLDAELKTQLAPLRQRGFIVFHDAYQYFEMHFGLKGLGAITLSPDVPPSARQLNVLRKRIEEQQVVCVLAEPQFKDAVVDTLIRDTQARKGLVNPDASDLPLNATLYPTYLRRVADAFADCLKPADGASSP